MKIMYLLLILLFPIICFGGEDNKSPFQIGLSAGYIVGYNIADILIPINGETPNDLQNYFNGEFLSGFYIGGNSSYELSKERKTGHYIVVKFSLEMYSNTIAHTEQINMLIDNEIKTATLMKNYHFILQYITIDAIYKFNFARHHIGIFIGPSYSFLDGGNYKISEEKLKIENKTLTRGNEISGNFHGLTENNFSVCAGIEFIIKFDKIELIPNATYYLTTREINHNSDWNMRIFLLGFDVRF